MWFYNYLFNIIIILKLFDYYIHIVIFLYYYCCCYYTNNKSSCWLFCSCSWSPVFPSGSDAQWGHWLDSTGLSGEISQLHSLRESGGGGDRKDVWWKTYRKYREEEKKEGKSLLMDQSYEYTLIHSCHSTSSDIHKSYNISVGQWALIVFVGSRWAGQHRAPVSASLQEDRSEGEEEGDAREQKNPEMERDNRLRTCKCISEPSWSLKRKQSRLIKAEWWIMIKHLHTVTVGLRVY